MKKRIETQRTCMEAIERQLINLGSKSERLVEDYGEE